MTMAAFTLAVTPALASEPRVVVAGVSPVPSADKVVNRAITASFDVVLRQPHEAALVVHREPLRYRLARLPPLPDTRPVRKGFWRDGLVGLLGAFLSFRVRLEGGGAEQGPRLVARQGSDH